MQNKCPNPGVSLWALYFFLWGHTGSGCGLGLGLGLTSTPICLLLPPALEIYELSRERRGDRPGVRCVSVCGHPDFVQHGRSPLAQSGAAVSVSVVQGLKKSKICEKTFGSFCATQEPVNPRVPQFPQSVPALLPTFVLLYVAVELARRESKVPESRVIGGRHPAVPPVLCVGGQRGGSGWPGAPGERRAGHPGWPGWPGSGELRVRGDRHLHPGTAPGSRRWPERRAARRERRGRREAGPWTRRRPGLRRRPRAPERRLRLSR